LIGTRENFMQGKKQVLIICHTAAGQMYLGILLNRIWYAPFLTGTTQEGLNQAKKTAFSLIILDGDMEVPALKTAITLLRADPSLKDIPLVVFLNKDNADLNKDLLSQGCSALAIKPLDLAMVFEVLARLSGQPRTQPRLPVKMLVEIAEGKPEKILPSVNISEGGLYLRTLEPLPEGMVLHIKFSLPHDKEAIELTAEVVRSLSLGTRFDMEPGIALRFLEVPDEIMLKIRHFIQWEMTGDLDWDLKI
jgi:CheY-like chemotaxis protein